MADSGTAPALEDVLGAVGPRLRALRTRRRLTLSALSDVTGISVSTLSRLESGRRRPNLELLLPLARAHGVPLDELVGAPSTGDPRVHMKPRSLHAMTVVPLTEQPGSLQAFKMIITGKRSAGQPDLKTHEGYEWLYVLSGRIRLVLGERDLVLRRGEAAEFDTRTPHWFGNAADAPAECLCLFGVQGERVHLRARPTGG